MSQLSSPSPATIEKKYPVDAKTLFVIVSLSGLAPWHMQPPLPSPLSWNQLPVTVALLGRSNGLGRVAKTAGRKPLGIDRAYRRALAHKTGRGANVGRLTVLQRNTWDTGLPTGSFDFVYCPAEASCGI